MRQDAYWRTPLMLALKHAPNADTMMELLVEAGASVNVSGYEMQTALHLATSRGLPPTLLLQAGANVAAADNDGNTPLHLAAQVCLSLIVYHKRR